ncbi:MAG TPA: glycosyltransferase family 4 protein [Candidatus Eisenbergiella merdavium]|uniref:Glycosyltransferase family 4 protein n=1 Tax=Candidatus Eisenbergiella merdavium TaxID=2838551 RepID=A0A9D2SSU9_9FIRM|nr:glycosyltransferase family 4 protein [Candidatus Eisenbergiella merdavium]
MKVLIVRTFPDILNLNTYNVQEIGLAKALASRGITCGVVLYAGKSEERKELYRFEKDGKEFSFFVYHLKGFSVFKNGFMPAVYRLMREYDVLQVHEYDQIFSWMLYSRLKLPTVIYHGPYYHTYARGYNLKCRVFDMLFLRNRKYKHVIALTKSELAADFLRNKGFSQVRAVGVGVDSEQFSVKEGEEVACRLQEDESCFRLLYVGKIEERRNVYFLIELFELLQKKRENIRLVIVGDGEEQYRKAFLDRIRPWTENGKIIYYQKATQKELALIYQRSDMFVFTSNYEIFGMVLLESMYFGLPVISSMNGGASVLINSGKNGYVMDSFNADLWAEKILAVAEDEELRHVMGREAKQTIEKHFLWDRLADQFIRAYSDEVEEYERLQQERKR